MQNKLLSVFAFVIIFHVCVTSFVSSESERGVDSRKKRFLLFPESTNIIQLIIGIGVPLELPSHAVILGWAYRAVYSLPSNLSQLMPMDQNTRRKRSVSRWDVYKVLEQMSEIKGFGGKACILRSICEASDKPFDKQGGLFEEIFHAIFTPTTTNENVIHHVDNEYYGAQITGRNYKGRCEQMFPECRMTLFDSFTQLESQ